MSQGKHPRGACAFCGAQTTKAAMARHIEKCPQREQVLAQPQQGGGEDETLLYLRVQDAYAKEFWLDLEMRGGATLKKLDAYLRAIWLECCGHLSEFSGSGWGSRKVGMSQTAQQVFSAQPELTHIYDFGTSSETLVTLKASRQGRPLSKHPIVLLARNLPPQSQCQQCAEPATHLCMECIYEDEAEGMLCAEHVKGHPHHNYGEPIALVNSPRLGLCGYDGPADPPY